MSERIDAEIKKAVSEAAGEPRAEVRARVVEEMAKVRPARGLSRRWALAAVGAMALVALGFVPIPVGEAPGALERAMAAMEQAASVHIIAHSSYWGRTSRYDEWWSEGGFRRMDHDLDDGWRRSVKLVDGRRRIWYRRYAGHDGVEQKGSEQYLAPGPREPPIGFPVARSDVQEMFSWINATRGWTVKEFRQRSLWAGTVDVIEAEGVAPSGPRAFPITYAGGDRVRERAELDSETGRLIRLETYVFDNGRWERTYWTECVEWNVDIPESVREFNFPEGTTVRRTDS